MIRLVLARTLAEIDDLKSTWEWLHSQQTDTTIFQSFRWNRIAAQCFDSEQPCIVLAESDSGVVLVPSAIRRNSEICLLGEELFDYRGLLHIGDMSVVNLAWSHLAAMKLPLAFTPFCGTGDREHWDRFEVSEFCKAPYVGPETSPDAFAASHPRLSRQLRRLARCGITVGHYSGENTTLLKEIYSAKSAPANGASGNLFSDPRRIDFVLTAAASSTDHCTIFTLEAGTTLVAALVTFREQSVRRFYTIYFNPAWAHYSPGIALVFEATRLSLAEGLSCDYMTGEHAYKLRLATGSIQLYHARGTFCRGKSWQGQSQGTPRLAGSDVTDGQLSPR